MFTADFIAFARLNCGVVVVNVIKLNLDDLDLGVLGQNLLENLRLIVELNADVLNFALFFKLERSLVCVTAFVFFEQILRLRVH